MLHNITVNWSVSLHIQIPPAAAAGEGTPWAQSSHQQLPRTPV